jgi:hypothetical protein
MSDGTRPTQDGAQVIRFRPRNVGTSGWRWPLHRSSGVDPAVADLSKFERTEGEDDYRHRMTVNALALLVTILLVVIGIWLATTIAEMRKNQDCFLQGHRNCNQVVTPPRDRD